MKRKYNYQAPLNSSVSKDYKDILRKELKRHYDNVKSGNKSRMTHEEVWRAEEVLGLPYSNT